MAAYIVCHRKRNSPRLNVQICQEKCPFKDGCESYQAFLKLTVKEEEVFLASQTPPPVAAAGEKTACHGS